MKRNWSEHRIVKLCRQRKMHVSFTEDIIDSSEHIDLVCSMNGLAKTIDVKGPSRIQKQDKEYSMTHRWLEIRNNSGLRGSLFGRADFIVIASPIGWLWVDRNEVAGECVLRYIENNGKTIPRGDWHTRSVKGRGSVIILVPYKYLYSIAVCKWTDNELYNRYYAKTK